MGKVVKRIVGDHRIDPSYENPTVEYNADGMVHIHIKNVRMDLTRDSYNELRKGMLEAREKIRKRHGNG